MKTRYNPGPTTGPAHRLAVLTKRAGVSDPIAAWQQAINGKIAGGMSRYEAMTALLRERPELGEAYRLARQLQQQRAASR